jgi:WS/DGAT/MGAT family acyltransferase
MQHWNAVMPGVMLTVSYENVVADLEGESRRILEYCDLPWEDACLQFHRSERASTTASALQVRQPVYDTSVGKWRRYEAQLEPLRVLLERVPPTPFNGHVSILRRVLWHTVPLHAFKSIKNRLGGTVNDAVLATRSGALRRYLESAGLNPDRMELRAMCPVNVRTADEHMALGNRISMMVAPLPVGIYDPVERYRQVRAAMAQIKASGESARMTRILDLMTLLPPTLQTAAGWLQVQSSPVNTICTNVPGPPVSLYTQGRRLETMIPLVPLAQGIGLAFAMLSYADTLTIGVTLDPALIRDGERIVECIGDSFEELCAIAEIERGERHGPVRPERKRRPSQVA